MSLTTGPRTALWSATGWDDPRVVALRAAMDAELHPRYAPPGGGARPRPPGPAADEVLLTWLALVDGEPAATASLRRLAHPGEPVRHEVKRVYVHPEHRRHGLAAAALARVEGSARAAGLDRLLLQTGALQPEAIALYRREGWTPVDPYPPHDALPHSRCFAKRL